MNWIHITDVVQSILFVIENSKTSQIFNLSAPHPVTMEVFCKKLGQRMKRPSWLHVPAFVLKMIFGQMAEETMLKGHKVLPENLLKSGYDFTYADIEMALNQLESL
jgi:NAD dependent epimerase/dehydratase family enzyme